MKKIVCLLLLLLITAYTSIAYSAPDNSSSTDKISLKELDLVSAPLPNAPSISSKYAIVFDNTTNTILYTKGKTTERLYPASITKILTAIVVMENIDDPDNTLVKVSRKATNISSGSSVMGLKYKDELSVTTLLYGLMLRSGNDAALALAEHTAGSVDAFVEMMNDKAEELGAKNSHFNNPHGLHNENHYTCLYDIALFANAYTKYPLLSKIAKTGSYTARITNGSNHRTLELENTNGFVVPGSNYYNKYFTGLKTGTTSAAGYCLATRYQKNSKDIIALTFDGNPDKYYSEMLSIVEYAEGNFTKINLKDIFALRDFTIKVDNATVADENNGMLALRIENVPDTTFVTTTSMAQSLRNMTDPITVIMPQTQSAPIFTGDNVGKITVCLNDQILIDSNLIATRTVLDHLDVPDDMLLLFLNKDDKTNGQPTLLTIGLIVLLAFLGLIIVFFLIKLYIYIMKQKKHHVSNVYSRATRKRSQIYTDKY